MVFGQKHLAAVREQVAEELQEVNVKAIKRHQEVFIALDMPLI